MQALTVIHPFGEHKKGEHITDPKLIAEVADSHSSPNVVRVNLPDPKPGT
jgi:hypothetical protein